LADRFCSSLQIRELPKGGWCSSRGDQAEKLQPRQPKRLHAKCNLPLAFKVRKAGCIRKMSFKAQNAPVRPAVLLQDL